jgi:signal-transduction protein with cAMP-binding, CBS, and nucleotidyltransferase domain
VKEAAELMNLHEIGCVVVVHSEKPVGILTERDMLKRIICGAKESGKAKVIDIMSKPLIAASPDMRAGDAAKLMFERNIKKLPVVENGRLVGLVTLTDLLRTEGVIGFLNKLSLNGTSKRMKKVVNLYSDALQTKKRKCPLMMREGYSIGCLLGDCMWWAEDECALAKISRRIELEEISQVNTQ